MSANKPDHNLFILAAKWLSGKITGTEKSEFDRWYNAFDDSCHELFSAETAEMMDSRMKQTILERTGIKAEPQIKAGRQFKLWPRIAVAASVILVAGIGLWLSRPAILNWFPGVIHPSTDIAPGKNTAILTLSNGKTITLSGKHSGVVMGDGKLTYNDGSAIHPAALNGRSPDGQPDEMVVTTPRGGTYQVTLPDGTRIWLNADSKISFPSRFSGKNRKVLLNGEAYFEVAKVRVKASGPRMPFIVESKGQEVEVLGTHFNINSYPDESSIKTTLLEGSVRVSSFQFHASSILKPGMQSVLTAKGITVQQLENADAVISWQSGYFTFKRENLDEIMRKVSRWYDVKVVFEDETIKSIPFSGSITRFAKVSELLTMLELTDKVEFRMEGKTIIAERK